MKRGWRTRNGRAAVVVSFLMLLAPHPLSSSERSETSPAKRRSILFQLGTLLSPGPLASPHAPYEGLDRCVLCHEVWDGVPDERCLDCHPEIRRSLAEPLGYHARAKGRCFRCHSDHRGRDFALIRLDEKAFSHDRETTYRLEGKHAQVACRECHTADRSRRSSVDRRGVAGHDKTRYRGLARDCAGCHPDVHRGRWGDRCEDCHAERDWKPLPGYWVRSELDHTRTRFPLKGRHAKGSCQDCHREGKRTRYKGIPGDCAGCHSDPHRPSWGSDCRRCHGAEGWRPRDEYWRQPGFDHARFAYPLEGAHREVACPSCHLPDRWKGLSFARCDACHEDRHRSQFPGRDCRECHTLSAWRPSTFQHREGVNGSGTDVPYRDEPVAKKERYVLDPLHFAVTCQQCHPAIGEQTDGASFRLSIDADRDEPEGKKLSGLADKARYRPLETTCRGCHRASDRFYRGEYSGLSWLRLPEAKSEAVDCPACHDPSKRRPTGEKASLMREARDGCVRCHNAWYGKLFAQWQEIFREKRTRLEEKLEELKRQATHTPAPHGLLDFYQGVDNVRLFLAREQYHNLLLADTIYDDYLDRVGNFFSIPR